MSVHITGPVWKAKIKGIEKLVLLKLADSAEDDGSNCRPSVPRMVAECGVSRGTVQRVLRSMEGKGWIAIEHPPGTWVGAEFRTQATYRVIVTALPAPAYRPKRKRIGASAETRASNGASTETRASNGAQAGTEGGPHSEAPTAVVASPAPAPPETPAKPSLAAESRGEAEGPHCEAGITVRPVSQESGGGLTVRREGPQAEAQSVLTSMNPSPPYPPNQSEAAGSTAPSLDPGAVSERSSRTGEQAPTGRTGEQARIGSAHDWLIKQAVRRHGERARYRFEPIALELVSAELVRLHAPSGFIASELSSLYLPWLREILKRQVEIVASCPARVETQRQRGERAA